MERISGKRGFILAILCTAFFCSRAAAASDPVFRIDFENGLKPDTWPETELKWSGEKPPRYDETGLEGKSLMIGESQGFVVIPAPENTAENGTVLFWSRGLENWNIWSFGATPCFTTYLAQIDGGMIYKWCWYDRLCLFAYNQPSLWFPMFDNDNPEFYGMCFDQYRWTQIGVSWQRMENGNSRVRLYLNGRMVAENARRFDFSGINIGGNMNEGGRRLIDNIKIWNRVLTNSEVRRLYRRDMGLLNQPLVSVPRTGKAPSIDGKIDPEEWAEAAKVTGMIEAVSGEMAADQSSFYLCYDDNYLYAAMQGNMTELARTQPALVYEKFLRAESAWRNAKVDNDDAVEIILSPEYWKAQDHAEAGAWEEYRLLMNSSGGYHTSSCGPAGTDTSWDSPLNTASTVKASGWHLETRIPLSSFGVSAPKGGDEWGLQIARVWKHLKDENDMWTWGYRYLPDKGVSEKRIKPNQVPPVPYQSDTIRNSYVQKNTGRKFCNLGTLHFGGEETPVVRVEKIGTPAGKNIDFKAVLFNPASSKQQVKIRFFTDTSELSTEENLFLPPGSNQEFVIQHKIENFTSSCLTFEVRDAAGTLIHRTSIPFYIEQSFETHIIQYPNHEKLLIELNLGTLSDVPMEELSVDMNISDAAGRSVCRNSDIPVRSYMMRLENTTSGFPCGDYAVCVSVRRGNTVIARSENSFRKTGKAVWWDNRYGCQDMEKDIVPYPWTDMKMDKDTIHVWNRQYALGRNFLPEQITTFDYPLLRAPMRLVLKTSGGETLDTSAVESRETWNSVKRTRIEGTRVIDAGKFSLKNTFWVEYDGLMYCRITLEPRSRITVDSLDIEIPLTKEFSDVSWYGWLGNGDGGIQVFQEGNTFFTKEATKTVRVERDNGISTWHMTLVDIPVEIERAYDVTLGFVATPVRPKTWRTPEFQKRSIGGGGAWFPKGLEFMPAADPGFDFYGYDSKAGRIYVHTMPVNTGADSSGREDFLDYGFEWLADPNERPTEQDKTVRTTTSSKSFRDYFVWRHWTYKNKYGFAGLYFDNPSQEGLYTRDIVRRLYNITHDNQFFGAREIAVGGAANGSIDMRYMAFWGYHWDGEHLNSRINSNQPTYLGIIDPAVYRAEYQGHNIGWPVYFLGQGRIKREWVEANGGPEAVFDQISGLDLLHDGNGVCCIMPAIRGAKSQEMRRVRERMSKALDKHDFYHWVYQFTPYWRQDIVKLPDENMHASFYIAQPSKLLATDPNEHMNRPRVFADYFSMYKYLPSYMQQRIFGDIEAERKYLEHLKDKAIIIVYNNTGWEGVMRLKVDWEKLGLGSPETLAAENAVHSTGFRLEKKEDGNGQEYEEAVFFPRPEEYAKIEGGELVFPMTRYNYRMLVIEKK